jgi:hypothetical protein
MVLESRQAYRRQFYYNECLWDSRRGGVELSDDHFRERTAALKREMEIFAEYAKRFYSPEFDWTRLLVSVQASEAEIIVNIIPTEMGAYVITSGFQSDAFAI